MAGLMPSSDWRITINNTYAFIRNVLQWVWRFNQATFETETSDWPAHPSLPPNSSPKETLNQDFSVWSSGSIFVSQYYYYYWAFDDLGVGRQGVVENETSVGTEKCENIKNLYI